MSKPLLWFGATVALMIGIILARTARFTAAGPAVVAPAPDIAVPTGAAERLAGSLRIPTVSHEDPAAVDAETFRALHAYLAAQFPRVHSQLGRESVSRHSLLYTWQGSDAALKPILLMGHLDVVPVEAGTEDQWQLPPFGGRIADGFIWGRGAIDNKSAVVGTLEAVERLLAAGFRPTRTVYLAYGHDEETGGAAGAREIAALLKGRGVALEMVLDEGGVISDGLLPGIAAPVALIGVAEKGFVNIALSVSEAGGHASMPPRQSAVGILSAAIARLEQHPMPARLAGPTRQMFDAIGPAFPFAQRLVFANLWLARPLVLRRLEAVTSTNAMVRTTTAATSFQAGVKNNVLASHARAVINVRILPGDSIAGVMEHVRRVIDDARVEISTVGDASAEPSTASSSHSEAFRLLEQTIRSVAPDTIVAPYLAVVATDARHYGELSSNIFRFLPVRVAPVDLARIHGINERIAIHDYWDAIRFYRQLLLDVAGDREIP